MLQFQDAAMPLRRTNGCRNTALGGQPSSFSGPGSASTKVMSPTSVNGIQTAGSLQSPFFQCLEVSFWGKTVGLEGVGAMKPKSLASQRPGIRFGDVSSRLAT